MNLCDASGGLIKKLQNAYWYLDQFFSNAGCARVYTILGSSIVKFTW